MTKNKIPYIPKISGLIAALAAFLMLPAIASAAITGANGVASEGTTINPNPIYAQGVPAQWQCLVCHADPKLKDDKVLKTLYFSREDVLKSAHISIGCAGCHSNYTTKPEDSHENISKRDTKEFIAIARASCTKCPAHADEVQKLKLSAHGVEPSAEAQFDQPKCADCHEFHNMPDRKKDPVFAEELHMNAGKLCGKCHPAAWDSYNDYYHGRAYKNGDVRAPSCQDCHTSHSVMFGDEAASSISKQNLKSTCSQSKSGQVVCHKNIDSTFLTYAPLIHGHKKMFQQNPLVQWIMGLIQQFLPKPALVVET